MEIWQTPGTRQSGHSGFSDQVHNYYMRWFGSAALMSPISTGRAEDQMAVLAKACMDCSAATYRSELFGGDVILIAPTVPMAGQA